MDIKALLHLDRLTKIYGDGLAHNVKALDNFSFDVYEGDFLAVMGPSGSGKSTLLNIIGTLDHSSSGNYYLQGERINGKTTHSLAYIRRNLIGFIFQEFYLLPQLNAIKNVSLPLTYKGVTGKHRSEIAMAALDRVGLKDRGSHKPRQLSGGEQQRLAVARALVNSPKLLLADEPTGNLDTRSGKMVMRLLQELNREGLTIIMVTHDTDMASYAKHIIRLVDGRLDGDSDI